MNKAVIYYFFFDKNINSEVSHKLRSLACSDYLLNFFGDADQNPIFIKTDKGKPYLRDFKDISFSVTHSKEAFFIAISPSDIAIDFEKRPFSEKNYEKIASRFFNQKEKELILKPDIEEFYKIWTKKEAIVKLSGEGLSALFSADASIDGHFYDLSKIFSKNGIDIDGIGCILTSLETDFEIKRIEY